MEKVLENKFNGKYNKYYKTTSYTIVDLAQQIRDSELEIMYVDVDEGVERDMQTVSRHYGLDEFLNMSSYIESAAYDKEQLTFNFLGTLKGKNVIITARDCNEPLVTLSSVEDLELEDILQKKNKGLGL